MIRLSKHDLYLQVYATRGSHSAFLIPAAPTLLRHIHIPSELFQKIARAYFAAHPEDNDICLVTDVYVTPKVAFDYRQNSTQTNYNI